MQLTDRFLDFADQQLTPVVSLMGFTHLGLYLSAPPGQEGTSADPDQAMVVNEPCLTRRRCGSRAQASQ
jgi:hypothetical protein